MPGILQASVLCTLKDTCRGDYCALHRLLGVVLAVYLAICYWAAFAYVFPNAEIFFTKWLLTKPLEAVERCFSRHDIHERFMHWRPQFPALYVSHILQALWWIASLALSASLRSWGLQESRTGMIEGSENDWSVGQILALLLICLPILSAVEIYFGELFTDFKRVMLTRLIEEENEIKARQDTQVLTQTPVYTLPC